jgi:hypothetical protein
LVTTGCIPDIPTSEIAFTSGNNQFYCSSGVFTVDVQYIGGVLPITWVTNIGKITPTGQRTATVKIHTAVGSPLQSYQGYATVDSPTIHFTCEDTLFGYAYVRLGKSLRDRGVGANCRYDCNYANYDCFDRFHGGDALCGDQAELDSVLDQPDCPFTFEHNTGFGLQPYQTYSGGVASSCLNIGGCRDVSGIAYGWPGVAYITTAGSVCLNDAALCNPDGLQCDTLSIIESSYLSAGAEIQDTRHPNLLALGCSPCSLTVGLDVVITGVDAAGDAVVQDIHVN